VIYLARVIILFPLVVIIYQRYKKGNNYLRSLRKNLFFNEIIISNIHAYFELLVAGYINYNFQLNSTNGEIVAQFVSYYAIFTCVVVIPAISIWVLI
jgi:hypothetical protein